MSTKLEPQSHSPRFGRPCSGNLLPPQAKKRSRSRRSWAIGNSLGSSGCTVSVPSSPSKAPKCTSASTSHNSSLGATLTTTNNGSLIPPFYNRPPATPPPTPSLSDILGLESLRRHHSAVFAPMTSPKMSTTDGTIGNSCDDCYDDSLMLRIGRHFTQAAFASRSPIPDLSLSPACDSPPGSTSPLPVPKPASTFLETSRSKQGQDQYQLRVPGFEHGLGDKGGASSLSKIDITNQPAVWNENLPDLSATVAGDQGTTAASARSSEYYGFALHVLSSAAFFMYLMWAVLPSQALHAIGITYYPDRWWALAVPAWLAVALMYVFIGMVSYDVECLTVPMDRIENLVDSAGHVSVVRYGERVGSGPSKAPPAPPPLPADQSGAGKVDKTMSVSASTAVPATGLSSAVPCGKRRRGVRVTIRPGAFGNGEPAEGAAGTTAGAQKAKGHASPRAGPGSKVLFAFPSVDDTVGPDRERAPAVAGTGAAAAVEEGPAEKDVSDWLGVEEEEARRARDGWQTARDEWFNRWSVSTDAVLDVPLGGVCEILFSAD